MPTRTGERWDKLNLRTTPVNRDSPCDFANTVPFVAVLRAFRLGKDTGAVFAYLCGQYSYNRRRAYCAAKTDRGAIFDITVHTTVVSIAEATGLIRQHTGSALQKLQAAGLVHRSGKRILLDFGTTWHRWTTDPLEDPPITGGDCRDFPGIRDNAYIRDLHIPTVLACAAAGGKNCAIDYLHRALVVSLSKYPSIAGTVARAGPMLYGDTNSRRIWRYCDKHAPNIRVPIERRGK